MLAKRHTFQLYNVNCNCSTIQQDKMNPKARYGTQKSIAELAKELNLPYEAWMQDWPIEVIKPSDIETYMDHYEQLTDEDKKFVLMEGILDATEHQPSEDLRLQYWNRVRQILEKDFDIHEYTVHTYACFDSDNIEDCYRLTPLLRELWKDNQKIKILFVCTVNRMRSATAHKVYEHDRRFEVKSAGTDKTANTVLSNEILNWADSIIVMETHHRNHIRKHFPDVYKNKKIVCLYIPDEYDFMQSELIDILKLKVEDVHRRKLIGRSQTTNS